MPTRVLLIDDDARLVEMLGGYLRARGYQVDSCGDGESGLQTLRRAEFDAVILDIMLPGLDGLEVCKCLRSEQKLASVPIIMLTAKGEETDKVVGLELGADDYVTKPFSVRELLARIKAVLRRGKEKSSEVLRSGDLVVDVAKVRVSLKGKDVDLTAKEFELLKTLMEAKGRVLSRDFLLNNIWGLDHSIEIQTRTVDVHILTLRKKLKTQAHRIVTVKNFGYRFDMDD